MVFVARIDNTLFYNASIEKYKQTAKGLHWASKNRQIQRFKIFKTLLEDKLSKATIVDAGCGFGDLYHYLDSQKSLPLEYIGLDSHQKMVNIARVSTQQKILHLDVLTATLPEADYYLCSGALNILEPFETLLFIKQMLRHARKGIVFNILKGENSSATYNKSTPNEMKEILSFFEGDIEIIEEYLDDDFTVFMKKEIN